jgi:hypothetical protein
MGPPADFVAEKAKTVLANLQASRQRVS